MRPWPLMIAFVAVLYGCGGNGSEAAATSSGGGSTTAGGGTCTPGAVRGCYSGPPNTMNVGYCKSGTQTCSDDGAQWGPCEGEVTPVPETCDTPGDDDCDGHANDTGVDCVCKPSSVEKCPYSGPPGTENVGDCVAGKRTCDASGKAWGPCTGEILPKPETCLLATDEDCDGQYNESGQGCVCVPKTEVACPYAGPKGTEGVGACHAGSKACKFEGTGYDACKGEVDPTLEDCVSPVDDDCDGLTPACTGAIEASVPAPFIWLLASNPTGGLAYAGDGRIGKLDDNGNELWSISSNFGPYSLIWEITVDATGRVCAAGIFESPIDFGTGPIAPVGVRDAFVLCTDPNGKIEWIDTIGDKNQAYCDVTGIAFTAGGGVAITGGGFGDINFPGPGLQGHTLASCGFFAILDANGKYVSSTTLCSKNGGMDQTRIVSNPLGGFVVAGTFQGDLQLGNTLLSAQSASLAVAGLDASGKPLWATGCVSTNHTYPGLAVDPTGAPVVAAAFSSKIDCGGGVAVTANPSGRYVLKLSPAGKPLWAASDGDAFPGGYFPHVAIDPFGNVLSEQENLGNQQGAVVKRSPDGVLVWSDLVLAAGNAIATDAKAYVFAYDFQKLLKIAP